MKTAGNGKQNKMKKLKAKFKKIKKECPPDDKLQQPLLSKLIKIKPKQGRWCEYYEGRIPYPIECTINKQSPIDYLVKNGKKTLIKNMPNCPNCKRAVEWIPWMMGGWDKIKTAVINGEDLTDMDPPVYEREK